MLSLLKLERTYHQRSCHSLNTERVRFAFCPRMAPYQM
uniref:Uncharacterized protein n=1 Tax=Arundo donax TaxID=35708 RepID=A0A0A9F6I4_ARUDO